MANLRLKFVDKFRDRDTGNWRYYFRKGHGPRTVLPGLPGSAEFMGAYAAALGGDTAPRLEIGASRSKPGSVAAVVALYLGSIEFAGLAERQRGTGGETSNAFGRPTERKVSQG